MKAVATNLTDQQNETKRTWVYAKKPSGDLYTIRQWVGYGLLLFLFGAPFIKIGGEPLLMFNVLERKFSLLGSIFYPQDLHIFVFGMLIIMVCVVLFTVVFGRIWCGWTCPQTIFMELIFRKIEYWIEGDWQQQRKLNEGPNTDEKKFKKVLKHSIFLLISFLISNIFLSYIIGVDALYKIVTDSIDQHVSGLFAIVIFTFVFYAVFAHIREIVCTTICPYGRLQGVLLDDQSITVAYDYRRGEPRRKQKKDVEQVKGDCIDCQLCVHVCPTGIDIRNGLQMECVSCTACVDACDAVMNKIGKPKKLIGFYAMGEIQGTITKRSNTRATAYSVVLVALVSVFVSLILMRSDVGATLLRAKGSSYQFRDDQTISNLYSLELVNKSKSEMPFTLVPEDKRLKIQIVNPIKSLAKGGSASLSFFLIINKDDVKCYKEDVKVDIYAGDRKIETLKTTFIAPPGM